MTQRIWMIAICGVLLMAAGCKSSPKEEPTPDPRNPEEPVTPTPPEETLKGDIARPTWTAPDDYDYTISMTAVVKVDLSASYPELAKDFELQDNDVLAAFCGDKCLGTISPNDGLFYLYIVETEGNVSLQYWSGYYTNTFVAKDAFEFKNGAHIGTVSDPLTPKFTVAGK